MKFSYTLNLIKKRLVNEYPSLSKYLRINYGLIPDEKNDKDWLMGASDDKLNWKIIKPDSNWLPEAERMIHEIQKNRLFDTMNCTRFSLNNVKEMIHIAKWNEVVNYSDRFPGYLQGTSQNGNSMNNQLECDRKYGCVKEEEWPFKEDFNWNTYYQKPPQEILDMGQRWLKDYTFGYDGVWATKTMIIEALKYSPLYVAVYAWYKKGMLYFSVNKPNHASTIISRDKYICYDSYDPFIKHLDEDFKIYYVKRIYLEKKSDEWELAELRELINDGREYLIRPENKGMAYKITENGLEYIPDIKDLSEDIAKYMKESPKNVNEMLRFLTSIKKIKWSSEDFYYSLKK